jgi:RecA-family ATPase
MPTAYELLNSKKKFKDHIVKNILGPELMMGLIGLSTVGKTMYAIEIAIRLLNKQKIPGWPKIKEYPQKVVFFTVDPLEQIRRRVRAISKKLDLRNDNLKNLIFKKPFIANPTKDQRSGNDPEKFHPDLRDLLLHDEEMENVDLIIIDPLSRFHTLDVNNNTEMGLVMDNLRSLCKKRQCSMIIIHHFGAGTSHSKSMRDRSRGATAIFDNWHSALAMEKDKNQIYLKWDDPNFRKRLKSFYAKREDFTLRITTELPNYLTRYRNKILTSKDLKKIIAKEENRTEKTAEVRIAKWKAAGVLKSAGYGRYKVP